MKNEPTRQLGTGSVHVDPDLVAARRDVFRGIRLPFTLLAATSGPTLWFISQSVVTMRENSLTQWVIIAILACTAAMIVTGFSSYTNSRISKHGLPLGFFSAATALAASTGAIVLVNPDPDFEFVAIAVGVILGSVGAVSITFSTIRPFARTLVLAIATPALFSPLVYGEIQRNMIGATLVSLLFAFLFPSVNTAQFEELVRLRSSAESRAETERKRSHHDHLTGLLNRLGISDFFNSTPSEDVSAVLFCDLDGFKDVNDRLGHEVGDQVLSLVGKRLSAKIANSGKVARLGGDEFLLVITSDIDQKEFADSLIDLVEEPFEIGKEQVFISASVGISPIEDWDSTSDFAEYLRRSDYALYAAKATGRGQAIEFSEELADSRLESAATREALRKATRSGEIDIWAQPIYDLATREIAMVELLARWSSNPDKSTAEFIAQAEETGIIDSVTELALAKFVECRTAWKNSELLGDVKIAVNISPRSFERGQIKDQLMHACRMAGGMNSDLVIEITEGVAFEHYERALEEMRFLRSQGIGIALDDFGAGFSSLNRFFELPLSEVKIDRSLVDGLVSVHEKQTMTRAIVMMSESLNRATIAEGVESLEQLRALASLGVTHAQGYFLAEPMPLDEVPDRARGVFGRPGFDQPLTTKPLESNALASLKSVR